MPPSKKPSSEQALPTERNVNMRIICKAPPNPEDYGAEFGLQDNSTTAHWIIHPGAVHPNGDIHFEFGVRVRPNARTGAPNFLGEFVHGDTTKRFVYLSWRPLRWRPGQPESPSPAWSRRMKVHLCSITWEQVEHVVQQDGVLEAVVEGTGRDGGPNCASVQVLGDGWSVRKR